MAGGAGEGNRNHCFRMFVRVASGWPSGEIRHPGRVGRKSSYQAGTALLTSAFTDRHALTYPDLRWPSGAIEVRIEQVMVVS